MNSNMKLSKIVILRVNRLWQENRVWTDIHFLNEIINERVRAINKCSLFLYWKLKWNREIFRWIDWINIKTSYFHYMKTDTSVLFSLANGFSECICFPYITNAAEMNDRCSFCWWTQIAKRLIHTSHNIFCSRDHRRWWSKDLLLHSTFCLISMTRQTKLELSNIFRSSDNFFDEQQFIPIHKRNNKIWRTQMYKDDMNLSIIDHYD